MEQTETDVRLGILNSFLTTPHRKLAELAPLHTDALARDPLFYAHLAPWYFARGEVRDHKVLFVAHLATSEYPEFRGAAWMLLQSLAPYEVARVLDHATKECKKVPRSLRTAIAHYLSTREQNEKQFDGAVLRARAAMKHLYASLHIHPSPRAQAILFDGLPPEGSPQAALKKLAKTEDSTEQARLILAHSIPYPTAIAAVKSVTPALLVALVEAMTPQEVINSMGMLKRRGALDHPDLKKLIDGKLEGAKKDRRVSTLKTKKAAEKVALDAETEAKLLEVTDARIAEKTEITRPTAIFADKSSSMSAAIEVAKQIAALVSAVATHGLFVYAFDSEAFPITVTVPEGRRPLLSDWEQAFRYIKANGSTAIGAPLVKMRKDGVLVEQIVIVTDEEEVTAPRFVDAYREYSEALHIRPAVCIVATRTPNREFEDGLRKAGIEFSTFPVEKSDYYSYPSLLALLAAPSRQELIDTIMATPLPVRPDQKEQVRA
jgi:hypothetical protein